MNAAMLWTPILLVLSNVVMTFAWYGHLKRPDWALWVAVLVSWGIAFFEYCLAVPANRLGYAGAGYSGQQLKVMQEAITLCVFAVFSVTWLEEPIRWNFAAAGLCLMAAVAFMFWPEG